MSIYRKILVVVDLTEDSETIGQRAKAVAAAFESQIELLHVVEYVPVEPMGEALLPAVQVEDELIERARQRLAELAAKLGLPSCVQIIESGNIKGEIVRVAKERNSDLIVMGARER
ncbi:MAG TPA: universal stress protein, partial [Steroidobacteraceae bacterium]|nr:universal stress protein [Steroidobacteraceae bacterium]